MATRKNNRLKPGINDLATVAPDVAASWDNERNGDLKPEHVAAHSDKKVWWKCSKCGMSWQATVDHRVNGRGCPYCAGRKPIPGVTDLTTVAPEVASTWDYENNGDLKPEHVTAHSDKKVWWKCSKCGMSWQARVACRVKGAGCPYDAGRLPIPGVTDLATVAPDVASSWDYENNGDLKPEHVTAHSEKKVWWKCSKCGMSWQVTIANRVQGTGCPYDAGHLPILGVTDLATVAPDVASSWDYEKNGELKPEQFTAHSRKKVWWKCSNCGMSWQATIDNRVKGHGCPYDSGRLPIPGVTDLATVAPEVASTWDHEKNSDLKPEHVTAHSDKRVWWKCPDCRKSWQATISHRVNGRGCPYCAGRKPIPGVTDLATVAPDVAASWDYENNGDLKPEQFTAHSSKKVWWKCSNCGMSWQAVINRRTAGSGCPFDAGIKPIPGVTDLATVAPQIASTWNYEKNGDLKPEHVKAHSNKRVWWKCPNCGMSWKAAIYMRVKGTSCPYDSGRYPIPGVSDLVTVAPKTAAAWDYERNGDLRPTQFTAHSHKKVFLKCPNCGKSRKVVIKDCINRFHCFHCSRRGNSRGSSI